MRTYVYTGDRGLDMHAWFEGMQDGRAFVTTGPLVELAVDGAVPGETVTLAADGGSVEIEARVRSITPLSRVMLVFNGEVVEEVPLDGDRKSVDFKKTLTVHESGWYHLRAAGERAERYPVDALYAQGFTNPVWIHAGDAPIRDRAAAQYALDWIDKLQEMAEEWPGWRSQKEKDHVYAQFDEARAIYRTRMSEARR